MILLSIFLVVCASAFGSKNTVEAFGANIYIVQSDGYEKAPKGSAVLVTKATAYEMTQGKLVLYTKSSDSSDCSLGYVKNIYVVDGQYYLTVEDGDMTVEVAEKRLVGRADYSSVFMGSVLEFIKTPFGVFCVAVLPCLALILYDVIRAAAARLPDPEVEPQFKNTDETGALNKAVENRRSISVNSDGKAQYSRLKPSSVSSGDEVLFDYRRKKSADVRPVIPLTDKVLSESEKPKVDKSDISEKAKSISEALNNSLDNTQELPPKKFKINPDEMRIGNTSEIPKIAKRDPSDAFFTQTSAPSVNHSISAASNAPQIGRQITKRPRQDSAANGEADSSRPAKSGKRSSQILATKRVEDLISDDDDVRSKKRMTNSMVDDIVSGIKNNSNRED